MMQISSTFRSAFLSPRTAEYVAALIREGDKFDYAKWLQKIREGKVQAAQASAGSAPIETAAAQCTSIQDHGWRVAPPPSARPFRVNTVLRGVALRRRADRAQTPEARIRRRLDKVVQAWSEFQTSRARDAVYGYLEAVFKIVDPYKVRRKTKKLLRRAFEFADLPFDKNADPFSVVIRCTCDEDVDSKTISKWARALRYVAHCKVHPTRVKRFVKEAGGVNACADRYAEYLGRRAR